MRGVTFVVEKSHQVAVNVLVVKLNQSVKIVGLNCACFLFYFESFSLSDMSIKVIFCAMTHKKTRQSNEIKLKNCDICVL